MSAVAADATHPALELTGIRKRFGDTIALDGAALAVRPGSVHALLGENGAGKTTLMRIAFGLVAPDDGTVVVRGARLPAGQPRAAIAAGLAMVHQHFTHVDAMTVGENVALGGRGRFDPSAARAHALAVGERAGLPIDPDARAGTLSLGARQRLEIVKALARDARVLILDEPTAVLSPTEAADLLRWIRGFASGERSAVLITHKLREALEVSDEVTVLRRGRTVLNALTTATDASSLATALIGSADGEAVSPEAAGATSARPEHTAVRAENVFVADDLGHMRIEDATFAVSAGEVVGIAAVEGSGHRELLEALAGTRDVTRGTLTVPPTVGLIPEDRHHDGLALSLSLVENFALRGAGARRGLMRWSRWRQTTDEATREFDVRTSNVDAPASTLSGGNQQRLILARELMDGPELVIGVNPTRGLDIRATAFVHDRLRDAARKGAAVIVHSADLDELLSLSDRVLVVHGGRIHEVPRDRDIVGRAMLGVA